MAQQGLLVAGEEKQLVLLDRSTYDRAELIALQSTPGLREIGASAKEVIAQKLEHAAVQLICAGLGDGAHPRCFPLLDAGAAGIDLELLQRIREGERIRPATARVGEARTVQTVIGGVTQTARYLEHRLRMKVNTLATRGNRHLGCCAGEGNQIGHIAPVERQLDNPLVIDHLADRQVPHLHSDRVGLYLDRLADLAHVEHNVDHRAAVDLQQNAGLHKSAETGQRRLQSIGTERQVRHHVQARLIGDRHAADAGVCLCCGDFHAG